MAIALFTFDLHRLALQDAARETTVHWQADTLWPSLFSLLTCTDWRCRTRPGKLYFTAFKMGRNGFDLPAFTNDIKKAYFLSDPDQTNVPVTVTNGVRVVQTSRLAPDAMANVIVVEFAGDKVER
jgi:hypothetical protein